LTNKLENTKQGVTVNEIGPAARQIRHPCRLLITGRSTMGKTTLAVDIILSSLLSKVQRCFAVCPTFWSQPALKSLRDVNKDGVYYFTNKTVFTQVDDSVFNLLYEVISAHPAPTLILIDDSAADRATNIGNKGAFSRLCISCNHHNTSMVGIFQRLSSASPSFRDNCEGLISFIPTKILDIDIIYKEFNPSPTHIKSLEVVKKILNVCWSHARFCFIWREAFTGKIHYYAGFKARVILNTHQEDDTIHEQPFKRRRQFKSESEDMSQQLSNYSSR
jgi:hypothetical protein